jgi:hypothetical protein
MQLFIALCNIIVALNPVASLSFSVEAQSIADKYPVQKVLQMLNGMLMSKKTARSEERGTFAEYQQYCQSRIAEKGSAVMDGKSQIAQLNAMISQATTDLDTLGSEIVLLSNDIDEVSSQSAMNQAYREMEHAEFTLALNTYISAIDSIDQALVILADTQRQSFAEVKDSLVASLNLPSATREAVMAFINSNHHPSDVLLDHVVAIVEKCGQQFKDEKHELETEEAQQKHASNTIDKDFLVSIDRLTKEHAVKMVAKAQTEKAKSEAQERLLDTTASVEADAMYLDDITQGCRVQAMEHQNDQSLDVAEISALTQVVDIMSGSAVARGSKHLTKLSQKGNSGLHSDSAGQRPSQNRVATILSDHARKFDSQILSLIAVRVAKDPFSKAKQSIQEMILKLMEEDLEESEHKGFCESESDVIQIDTRKGTRDRSIKEMKNTTAIVEDFSYGNCSNCKFPTITANFVTEAADLSYEISDLDEEMTLATHIRSAEEVRNAAMLADAKAASKATEQALRVLNRFYEQSNKSNATGVVSLLEAIESDFIRLETETQVAEYRAEKDYIAFKRNSYQVKVEKVTQMSYLKQQKPSYGKAGDGHEHVMRRKEEIRSLTEALKILSDRR